MAITATTLSAAKAAGDLVIQVASATGFALKKLIRIDNEFFVQSADNGTGTVISVICGQNGSAQVAHNKSAAVLVGDASDFADPPAGEDVAIPFAPAWTTVTYGVAGAIALPVGQQNTFVELVTGTAGAFTIADPTSAMEGVEMVLMAKDAEAYTVTNTTGFNGGSTSSDVATYNGTIGSSMRIKAVNKVWNALVLTGVTLG